MTRFLKNANYSVSSLFIMSQLLGFLNSCAYSQVESNEYTYLMSRIVATVQSNHLQPKAIDDSLSIALFTDFIARVDPEQKWLTTKEIAQLNAYQFTIDDDIQQGNYRFFAAVADRLPSDRSRESLFHDFIDSYLSINDYQSDFMSPAEREQWNASFNRSLVGTGISFEIGDEYPKITEVYVNGPAWNTAHILAGDQLLGLQLRDDTYVDLAGLSSEEVSSHLLGEEGSTLGLKVRHTNGQTETVAVRREHFALSRSTAAVLQDKNGQKIGYIRLPRYYSGDYSSAADILADLQYLQAEKVAGLILDVRNNKGGSAAEAVNIVGYFLHGEPVMRSVYRDGRQRTLSDEDPTAQYEGKLLVLVNQGSASASELTAATLQQYRRALIVGRQTFGKGTIQRFFEIMDDSTGNKLGDVKLTIGSFYAGKGYATQFRGVSPDISLPLEDPSKPTGEREVKHALRIEHLPEYVPSPPANFLPDLQQRYELRMKQANKAANYLTMEMKKEISAREKAHWELIFLEDVELLQSYWIMEDYLAVGQ
jgi:C-terminal peptidase prc